MKSTIILLAVLTAGLWLGSSFDKEVLLIECVQEKEGTDSDCDECYYKVYGTYPTH